MIAGMVLTNLLYVIGAIVATAVVSAFVLLRHRRPKSLEAGIEMFSRELKALEPERRVAATPLRPPPSTVVPSSSGAAAPGARVSAAGTGATAQDAPLGAAETRRRNEAGPALPDRENEPG